MNVVFFQYFFDLIILISVVGMILGVMKKKNKLRNFSIIVFILTLLSSYFVFVNFTGTTKRIAVEKQNANNIFQSRMKEPKEVIKNFNYKEQFKDVSKTITTQANDIHKEVKENK